MIGADVFVAEWLQVSAKRAFEVEDGWKGICAEPCFYVRERRDALDLEPHPGV